MHSLDEFQKRSMPSAPHPYDTDLDKNAANYVPLTPLSFLPRSAAVHPDRIAIVHHELRQSWAETYRRCRRLASALVKRGIRPGDTVSVMAPNIPAMAELHFGVAMAGAVLNTLNVRLDPDTIAFSLVHAEAKLLVTDPEFSDTIKRALGKLDRKLAVIDIDDPFHSGGERLGETTYEALLAEGDPDFAWSLPADEWQAISLNYTSGTTGNPKGVVYHHRGAYLNAIGNALVWQMGRHPVYLWTLPMFHCNGWCFPWTVAAMAGTNVCLRRVDARHAFELIEHHRVTHLSGAPIVMNLLIQEARASQRRFGHTVELMTAAAPPPAAVIEAMEKIGFHITHVYGLTETYGPAVVCEWKEEWDVLPERERADLKARQGVTYPVLEGLMVADPKTLAPVPADGQTMGEVFFRGNNVMKGYLKNEKASTEAFAGGWFHSGDLGVMHADGYIQLKDRAKDIIISGGENISTIEVEGVLYRHPAVLEAAVVARPDEKWGETPCAFVTLKPDAQATATEIVAFCREHLAHYKVPRTVVFGPLPKTSTGKVQKFVLRERAKALGEGAG
ncbi:MAG: acyl-CoA synthetase [Pseudomonadota bacterium]